MVLLKMSLGHFSYPWLDLCLVKLFLVFLNGLWSRAVTASRRMAGDRRRSGELAAADRRPDAVTPVTGARSPAACWLTPCCLPCRRGSMADAERKKQ